MGRQHANRVAVRRAVRHISHAHGAHATGLVDHVDVDAEVFLGVFDQSPGKRIGPPTGGPGAHQGNVLGGEIRRRDHGPAECQAQNETGKQAHPFLKHDDLLLTLTVCGHDNTG